MGTGRRHGQATVAQPGAEQMVAIGAVDVLHAALAIDHKDGTVHDIGGHLRAHVEQHHLLVSALVGAQDGACFVPLLGRQRCVNIVAQVQRSERFCKSLFETVTGHVNRGVGRTGHAHALHFSSNPRPFGLMTKHPRRGVEMGEGIEVLERGWDDTERGQHHRLNAWMVDSQPFQQFVDALAEGPSDAVEHNRLLDFVVVNPAHVKVATGFGDVRSAEGVVSAPLNATDPRGLLAPNDPVPRILPHALVLVNVPRCVSVVVEVLRANATLNGW